MSTTSRCQRGRWGRHYPPGKGPLIAYEYRRIGVLDVRLAARGSELEGLPAGRTRSPGQLDRTVPIDMLGDRVPHSLAATTNWRARMPCASRLRSARRSAYAASLSPRSSDRRAPRRGVRRRTRPTSWCAPRGQPPRRRASSVHSSRRRERAHHRSARRACAGARSAVQIMMESVQTTFQTGRDICASRLLQLSGVNRCASSSA